MRTTQMRRGRAADDALLLYIYSGAALPLTSPTASDHTHSARLK